MKLHWVRFLSTLFLISSCSSYEVLSTDTPPITSSLSKTTPTAFIEPTPEPVSEVVLLDYALSPNGEKLAVYLNTGIYLYDVDTARRTILSEFESGEYYSQLNTGGYYYPPIGAPGAVTFSPDGKEMAISGKFQDELIAIWDWKSKTVLNYLARYPNGNSVRELEYAPDGSAILVRSTYPLSKLHCGVGSEDTLTLISLSTKSKLFEKEGCNQYSSIDFYFAGSNTLYLFHYGTSVMYLMYETDIQTGDILMFNELDTRSIGLIYGVSPNGKIFAVRDDSSMPDEVFRTVLVDSKTKEDLFSISGRLIFLNGENRFLVITNDSQHYQVQLQESNVTLCKFDGLEFLDSRISRNKSTLAVFTRDMTIQLWDIPSCQMLNAVPIN